MAEKSNTPTEEHNGKNCHDEWGTDLKEAQNQLQMTLQEKAGLSTKNSNASLWEEKLSMFWRCIRQTEELTQDISGHLELFLEHTHLVCNNIECSQQALRFLYCKTKEVFECTDSLREKILDFNMKVDCLGDDNINVKSSFVVECVAQLSAKLEIAVAKQQELLKKLIEIIQCIDELQESICNKECGVEGQLNILISIFKRSGEESITCDLEKSCKDQTIEPKPVLPLNCDKVYVFTKTQQQLAEEEKKEVKQELEEACKEYESAASCERSLKEAIDSSKAVQECK